MSQLSLLGTSFQLSGVMAAIRAAMRNAAGVEDMAAALTEPSSTAWGVWRPPPAKVRATIPVVELAEAKAEFACAMLNLLSMDFRSRAARGAGTSRERP